MIPSDQRQQQQSSSRRRRPRIIVRSGQGVRSKELHKLIADHLHTYIWLREAYDPYRPKEKKTGKPPPEMSAYITFIMELEINPVFQFEGKVDPRTKVNKIFIDRYRHAWDDDKLMQSIRQQGRPPRPSSSNYLHEFPPPFTPVHQNSSITLDREAIMSYYYRRQDKRLSTETDASSEHVATPSGAPALSPSGGMKWQSANKEVESGSQIHYKTVPVRSGEPSIHPLSAMKSPPNYLETRDDSGVLQIKYDTAQRRILELEAKLAAATAASTAEVSPLTQDPNELEPISDPQEKDANLESLLFDGGGAAASVAATAAASPDHYSTAQQNLPPTTWEAIEDNHRVGKRGKMEEVAQDDDRKPAATTTSNTQTAVSIINDLDNYDIGLSPLSWPSPLGTPAAEATPE